MTKRIIRAADRVAVFHQAEYSPNAVNPIPDDPQRPRTPNDAPHPDTDPYLPFDSSEIPQGTYKPITLYRGVYINRNDPDPLLRPIEDIISGGRAQNTNDTLDGYNPDIPRNYTSPQLGPAIFNYLKRRGGWFQHGKNLPAQDQGFGTHWSTSRDFAQHMAMAGMDDPDYEGNQAHSGLLPVVIEAQWNHQGEDPNRTGVGWISPETANREREITLLPKAPLTVTNIHIRHPQGTWHSVLDKPIQHFATAQRNVKQQITAMPAPLPEGLTFKVHPDQHSWAEANFDYPYTVDNYPVVTAHDPKFMSGHPAIGHLEWFGDTPPSDRLRRTGKPGEIAFINVRPEYRRHNVATSMFDWAKENVEPRLHHSDERSELGKLWRNYEQSRKEASGHSLLVGPDLAYDEWDWAERHKEHPPVEDDTDPDWYHVSPHQMDVGTELAPFRGTTPWQGDPYQDGLGNRADWVWVEHDEDKAKNWMHWVGQHNPEVHLYQVKPHLGPFAWNGTADEGWVTDRATITAELTTQGSDRTAANLVTVYHGTHPDIADKIVGTQSWLPGNGGWFTTDPERAKAYGSALISVQLPANRVPRTTPDFYLPHQTRLLRTGPFRREAEQRTALRYEMPPRGAIKITRHRDRDASLLAKQVLDQDGPAILWKTFDSVAPGDKFYVARDKAGTIHGVLRTLDSGKTNFVNELYSSLKAPPGTGNHLLRTFAKDTQAKGKQLAVGDVLNGARPWWETMGANFANPNNPDSPSRWGSWSPEAHQALIDGDTLETPNSTPPKDDGEESVPRQMRVPGSARGFADYMNRQRQARRKMASPTARYILLPHWDAEECVDILRDHDADMRMRTAAPLMDQQWGNDVMNSAKQGGFTLHDHVGDGPTDGYMVSLDKQTEYKRPISELTPDDVRNFVTKHSAELTKPNNYLGGWLDGGQFYLDISSHIPDLNRATSEAVRSHQLGIYDLAHGRTINTDEAGWLTGNPGIVGSRNHDRVSHLAQGRPRSGGQHSASGSRSAAVEDRGSRVRELYYLTPPSPHRGRLSATFDPAVAIPQGAAGGTHGAQVYRDPTNTDWIVKTPKKNEQYLAHVDVAANTIAGASGIETPETYLTQINGSPASAQVKFPGAVPAFPNKVFDPEKISDDDLLTVQKHHALDWLLSNHDSHPMGFIRLPNGKLAGIDKGQAFKYFGQDKLGWNFHPNQYAGETEPVYNTLYKNFIKGGRKILDPHQGELAKYIQGLQDMPDEKFTAALQPYVDAAVKLKALCHPWLLPGLTPPTVPANDGKAFLAAALARKHNLSKDFGNLYDRAVAHRMTGTKIAAVQGTSDPTLDLDLPPGEAPLPLYRGLVLDLQRPDMGMIRRSLLGNSFESNRSPDEGRYAPCNGCPHPGTPPQNHPGPGDGVQGSLPLTKDFSDRALATNGKARWQRMGPDILDMVGPGDDSDWTTDATTAQKMALQDPRNALRLPVMLSKASPMADIDMVSLLHPQTGHWHDVMPPEIRVSRKAASGYARPKHFKKTTRVSVPIEVLKQYSTFNPYTPEDGESPEQVASYMAGYEDTLKNEGWEGFGKLDQPPSYPVLSVGKSGKHAVLNGHHRLWAADKLGMTHVPVDVVRGEDDEWARKYGMPVEPYMADVLKQKVAYAPDPDTMRRVKQHDQDLGTHGSQLWEDPQGRWLLKKPGKNQEFMIPLDVATSQLQQMAGLEGPEVHAVPMKGGYKGNYLVSAHKMYPGAQQAWQKPPHLHEVAPDDLLALQKHQALDWLIANHDPHVGNFLRTQDGGLVGIDKGQALKYFGRDRLDWGFHPNHYAREPIYNNLWRDFSAGRAGEMLDPRQGELGDFVQHLQSIPDDTLKELFHPYADAAARVGLLATGDKDPQRGLTPPRVVPNNPDAFLDALVKRKNNLANDLGDLYDRAATHRQVSHLIYGDEGMPLPPPPQPKTYHVYDDDDDDYDDDDDKPWFLQQPTKKKQQYVPKYPKYSPKSPAPDWEGEVPQYGPPKHEKLEYR